MKPITKVYSFKFDIYEKTCLKGFPKLDQSMAAADCIFNLVWDFSISKAFFYSRPKLLLPKDEIHNLGMDNGSIQTIDITGGVKE